jgi:uncharacterized protein YcbX
MPETLAELVDIHRFPIKGLAPDRMSEAQLEPGLALDQDRAWAIGPAELDFDAAAPAHKSKAFFIQLMGSPALARIGTRFVDNARAVELTAESGAKIEARLDDPVGRETAARFIALALGAEMGVTLALFGAPGLSLSDIPRQRLSIINLETVRAISAAAGKTIDPLRFRGNLLIDGAPAFSEFDWVGRDIAIGGVTAHVEARITRCQATSVDLEAGARDLDLPKILMSGWDHADCGVYVETKNAGRVTPGASISFLK